MTDTESGEAATTYLKVPVTKAGNATVDVDTNAIPDNYYKAALAAGLKVIVNGGMTKISKTTYPDPEQLKAAAIEAAQARVALMMEGKLKLGRQAAVKGPSGAVMTEARRLARQLVKDLLRKNGLKVSHYEASEITRAANDIIAEDPSILQMAEANINARAKIEIDVSAVADMQADPKLVAKAEEAKVAKRKEKLPGGLLSAKQAGKVAPRQHAQH